MSSGLDIFDLLIHLIERMHESDVQQVKIVQKNGKEIRSCHFSTILLGHAKRLVTGYSDSDETAFKTDRAMSMSFRR